MAPIDQAIKASTQEHLDIHTIKEHLVILKDGSAAMVLQTSAINFGLFSEEEQDAAIYGYAGLLNSLSFPIQILMRSTRKDITQYLEYVDEQIQKTRSQKIKEQIIKYRAFIKSLVKENRVLEKKFYIVIPYSLYEVSISASNFNPFAKAPQKPAADDDYILNKAKLTLYPRRDHLIRQLARIGLQARQLNTQELVSMFYRIYNPTSNGSQQVSLPEDYETTSVESTTRPTGVVSSLAQTEAAAAAATQIPSAPVSQTPTPNPVTNPTYMPPTSPIAPMPNQPAPTPLQNSYMPPTQTPTPVAPPAPIQNTPPTPPAAPQF